MVYILHVRYVATCSHMPDRPDASLVTWSWTKWALYRHIDLLSIAKEHDIIHHYHPDNDWPRSTTPSQSSINQIQTTLIPSHPTPRAWYRITWERMLSLLSTARKAYPLILWRLLTITSWPSLGYSLQTVTYLNPRMLHWEMNLTPSRYLPINIIIHIHFT